MKMTITRALLFLFLSHAVVQTANSLQMVFETRFARGWYRPPRGRRVIMPSLQRSHSCWLHRQGTSSSSSSSSLSLSASPADNDDNDLTTNRDETTRPNNNNNNNNNHNNQWMASLQARQQQLLQKSQSIHDNWKAGRCTSQVAAAFDDWVRRLDVDFPLVACGSASETIYLSNLETGEVLAESKQQSKKDNVNNQELSGQDHVYRLLFGDHDGGGTLAIAFYDDMIASAGRQGSVDLWRVVRRENSSKQKNVLISTTTSLIYQGRMIACQGVLVTSLHFQPTHDAGTFLWVGTADGRVMAFDEVQSNDRLPLAARYKPFSEFSFPNSVILSMSFTTELQLDSDNDDDDNASIGVGVITTSTGNIHLIPLMESSATTIPSEIPASWSFQLPLEARSPKILPTCACFVQHDTATNGSTGSYRLSVVGSDSPSSYWSIACGGSNGSLYLKPISLISNGLIDSHRPFDPYPLLPLIPRHWGPTQCVATPMPGLLLSSGQDGSIRVWDVSSTTTTATFKSTTTTKDPSHVVLSPPPARPLLRRRFLYQFHGYKVWLKSLWCGGKPSIEEHGSTTALSPFLVSDGCDNTILIHKFNIASAWEQRND